MRHIKNISLIISSLLMALVCSYSEARSSGWSGIVIHISDSTHMTKEECDQWHRERGWDSCGYNIVIEPDGTYYRGRGESEVGTHTKGYNSRLFGIAFVTKDLANQKQLEAFHFVMWRRDYRLLPLYPHNKFANKRCPGGVWEQVEGKPWGYHGKLPEYEPWRKGPYQEWWDE